MRLWELYEALTDAGRLVYEPDADRWILDGRELSAGTDYLTVFREAVGCGPTGSRGRSFRSRQARGRAAPATLIGK